jgi:predicted aconitase with swiveling domain
MNRSGVLEARVLVAGEASGEVLVLGEPLSFWGGLEPTTGVIIDRRHPQRGERVTGRILVLPGGRGSSSSSTVLAEAIRLGTAPRAIVLAESDPIIAIGAMVARELYHVSVPVVVLNRIDHVSIEAGERLHIANGSVARESA